MTTLAEVEAAAFSLPEGERIALGRRLMESPPAVTAEPPPSFPGESGVLLRRLLERRWAQHLADPTASTDVDEFIAELEAEDAAEAAAAEAPAQRAA